MLWKLRDQPRDVFPVHQGRGGIVMFGSLTGSMLPFILQRAGFDPASASAPFVATLVDVTGLVIYHRRFPDPSGNLAVGEQAVLVEQATFALTRSCQSGA